MFQKRILKAGVTAREIPSRTARFWKVTQDFRAEPKAPLKIVAKILTGFSPVSSIVTTAQTTRASRMAQPRMAKLLYQGRVSRLAMWNRDCFLFICLASLHAGHQRADLPLVGSAGVHHAGHLTAAEDHDPVAQLQQHVQILAHIHHGDALHFLLR